MCSCTYDIHLLFIYEFSLCTRMMACVCMCVCVLWDGLFSILLYARVVRIIYICCFYNMLLLVLVVMGGTTQVAHTVSMSRTLSLSLSRSPSLCWRVSDGAPPLTECRAQMWTSVNYGFRCAHTLRLLLFVFACVGVYVCMWVYLFALCTYAGE